VKAITNAMADDPRLGWRVQSEVDYYKAQTASGAPINIWESLSAIIFGVGIQFAARIHVRGGIAESERDRNSARARLSKAAFWELFLSNP